MTAKQNMRAEDIKNDLATIDNCSSSTVANLTQLLTVDSITVKRCNKTGRNIKARTAGNPTSRKRVQQASSSSRTITAQGLEQELSNVLSSHEKFRVATEVVNNALKLLTGAVKSPQKIPPHVPNKAELTDGSNTHIKPPVQSTSDSKLPLQPRAPNCASSSPAQSPKTSTWAAPRKTHPGLVAVAECAHIAFSYLGALKSGSTGTDSLPQLQLEHGMSALVGKLIALRLDEMALRELRVLRSRLQSLLGIDVACGESKTAVESQINGEAVQTAKRETLSTLLTFDKVGDPGPIQDLIVATQVQVLRLIVLSKRKTSVDAVLQTFRLSSSNSPINLILKSAVSSMNSVKGAQQLQTISQLLLSLCPGTFSLEDKQLGSHVSRKTSLDIQCLALKARLHWWALSGHNGDFDKDILGPLLTYLDVFSRQSPADQEQYKLAASVYSNILKIANRHNLVPNPSRGTAHPRILKLLGTLAKEAGLIDAALQWTRDAMDILGQGNISQVGFCVYAVRTATLTLLQLGDQSWDEGTTQTVQQAAEQLESNIRGTSAELDELIIEVGSIRRAAFSTLSNMLCKGEAVQKSRLELPPEAIKTSIRVVFACVRVFSNYLGSNSVDREDNQSNERYEQRRDKLRKVGLAATDSAFYLLRDPSSASEIEYREFNCAIKDCLALVAKLGPQSSKSSSDAAADTNGDWILLKASNAYWAYYLRTETAADENQQAQILQCLQKSVDLAREAYEQGLHGTLLAIKLERLGNVYTCRKQIGKGRQFLSECLRTHINDGQLSEVVIQSERKGLSKIEDVSAGMVSLGRALSAYLKVSLKEQAHTDTPEAFFDNPTLDDASRGCLLEWQLLLLSGMLDTARSPESCLTCIQALSDVLLNVYIVDKFPLRRMRILATLMGVTASHYSKLYPSFLSKLLHETSQAISAGSSTFDDNLEKYRSHYKALLSICISLQHDDKNLDIIRDALIIWSQQVDQAESLHSLQERIDDVHLFLKQLLSVADLLVMQGVHDMSVPTLNLVVHILQLQQPVDPNELVNRLSALALQYLELGYSGKAGLVITKARSVIDKLDVSSQAVLRWQLIQAEYMLIIGNLDKCSESLEDVQAFAERDPTIQKYCQPSASLGGRINVTRLLADASYVYSRWASEKGQLSEALIHAKKSVQLNYRAWASIESRMVKTMPQILADTNDPEEQGGLEITSGLAALTLQGPAMFSTTHKCLNGPSFWSSVPSFYRGLKHLSQLFSHIGLFQEAVYYGTQARKIAEAIQAEPLLSENMRLLGELYVRGGEIEKGGDLIEKARDLISREKQDRALVSWHCYQGHIQGLKGQAQDEMSEYNRAERILEKITSASFIEGLDGFGKSISDLVQETEGLTLATKSKVVPSAIAKNRKKPVTKTIKNRTVRGEITAVKKSVASSACPELFGLHGSILCLKASVEVMQRRFKVASSLLAQAERCPLDKQATIRHRISHAKRLFEESLAEISSDPVFCVLEESTISFPAINQTVRRSNKTVVIQSPSTNPNQQAEKSLTETSTRAGSKLHSLTHQNFVDVLDVARESLLEALSMAVRLGSTPIIRAVSLDLGKISLLLSAAALSKSKNIFSPVMAGYYAEMAKLLATRRERQAILVDKQTYTKEQLLKWPKEQESSNTPSDAEGTCISPTQFQQDYIDIIPPNWSVISIALSENSDALLLSKLRTGQSPFILRLPLGRHNSRDADEEIFDYERGRTELLEIIELANYTAHDARDMTQKGAKSRWWAEREALNSRLKDLICNIETIWLGGFRGVFSQSHHRPELLSRFQHSFHNILDKYLPSRRKVNKRRKTDRVNLTSHVLDLFVGLGELSGDIDIDEQLMDLLYFVIDILQFQGEHNAYDEIDFDSIVVETKDALRSYYDIFRAETTDISSSHIILILDKSLHGIPWESLPCLDGLSVSRLPSLVCLRERLSEQRYRTQGDRHGIFVNKENGTYVLNPSGDLKATQAVLEDDLKSLRSWESITQRAPTEPEIKEALESRDLFLYFGHGSGGQYIRGRTIRKLDKCAVALLMGCSSGSITDPGEFEPYGTPINYLHAGCPAMLATLWDVTDKDIDRFSQAVFRRWGLFASDSYISEKSELKGGHRKARGKVAAKKLSPMPPEPGTTSLVGAVAQARDSCVLRYLNGAAPIVYGVPVYLS